MVNGEHSTDLRDMDKSQLMQVIASQKAQLSQLLADPSGGASVRRTVRKVSRPPMIHAYCRVSHQDSKESGLGVDAQIAMFEARFANWSREDKFPGAIRSMSGWNGEWSYEAKGGRKIRTRTGKPRTDGIFVDLAVSAYRWPFRTRPAGWTLDSQLQSGDIVVFPKLDRAFRSLRDFANTIEEWDRRGISVVFIQPDVDLSGAFGKCMANILASFAEFESALKSERIREAMHQSWVRGKPLNGRHKRVYGFRSGPGGTLRPYYRERQVLADTIFTMRSAGEGWRAIAEEVERRMAIVENRPPRLMGFRTPAWTRKDGMRKKQPERSEYTRHGVQAWAERFQRTPLDLFPPKDATHE